MVKEEKTQLYEHFVYNELKKSLQILSRNPEDGLPKIYDYREDGYKNSQLDIFSEGLLVPLILDKDLKFSNIDSKFIGIPDMLFLSFENGNVNIYPIDIKNEINLLNNITPIHIQSSLKQISLYNLANLASKKNTFVNEIFKYISQKLKKEIVLNNGCYILNSSNEDMEELSKKNTQDYLSKYLRLNVREHLKNLEIGIDFREIIPKLNSNLEDKLIMTNGLSYTSSIVSKIQLREHLRFVKNKINENGFYPNHVIAITGFDEADNHIPRFIYNPEKSIVATYEPEIKKLEEKLFSIKTMSIYQINKQFQKEYRDINKLRLTRLNESLKSQELQITELYTKIELNKKNNNAKNKYLNQLEILEEKIKCTENEIIEVKEEINKSWFNSTKITEKEKSKINEELKSKLISTIENQIEMMNQKLLQRQGKNRKQKKRNKKQNSTKNNLNNLESIFNDIELSKKSSSFINSIPFQIQSQSLFHRPIEIFLEFNSEEILYLKMYSSIPYYETNGNKKDSLKI